MNKLDGEHAISVMKAWILGSDIQTRTLIDGTFDWIYTTSPTWNWAEFDYRVKPKPLELWIWVKEGKQSTVSTSVIPI